MALTRWAGRAAARTAVLALTATTLVAVTGTSALADYAVAGAQTVNDSLFPHQGNGGYDVSHYDIGFRIDIDVADVADAPATTTVDATTTIEAKTTGAALSSYSLDFQGTTTTLEDATLNVESVTVNGEKATFERIERTTPSDTTTDTHKLVITPAKPVRGAFTTVVKYSGQPVMHTDADETIEGWNNTVDGASFVNQPVGSMTLFPNNDTPRDKATYTWTIDAPTTVGTSAPDLAKAKPYQVGVASNGELISRKQTGDGSRTTWVWDQKNPMASELSLFSIGRYDIYTSQIELASGRTIPEWTFIDPALSAGYRATTLSSRGELKQMLDFFEAKYGPYPGNSVGLVTDNTTDISYALETQDRPFYQNAAKRSTTYHEIMHQWFGNNVSPVDWNDIWLDEGPATFSQTQFPYEGAGSTTVPGEKTVFDTWNTTAPTKALWNTPVAAMTDAVELFESPTYTRGNMTLYALRTAIGADTFAAFMREWQDRYGGTSRRTADFIALAEEMSGRDLTSFFHEWLYTTGKPAWPVKFDLSASGPDQQVNAGDEIAYRLTARNTGRVAMPAGGTTITFAAADILDDATVGTLPDGVTLDGTTFTWQVPATDIGATSTVELPFTLKAETSGHSLEGTARAATLGGTAVDVHPSTLVGVPPISPAPAPSIAGLEQGAPVVGQALTADTAGWPAATKLAYQWRLNGTPVPGATSATYTPTVETVGAVVTVQVIGTLAGAVPTRAVSEATKAGVPGALKTASPTIAGSPAVGSTLSVDLGAWQRGTVFTYQWRAGGTNIPGATGPVYTPLAEQAGKAVDVVVTGTNAGYATVAHTSEPVTVLAVQTLTPTPTVTGSPKVGGTLTADPGTWDEGTTLAYQWTRGGVSIAGATSATYRPVPADLGRTLAVVVTGAQAGFQTVSRTSTGVKVAAGVQTRQAKPVVVGRAKVGRTLRVRATYDAGTSVSYTWLANGRKVGTKPSLKVGKALRGTRIAVRVTVRKPGYASLVLTSARTARVR